MPNYAYDRLSAMDTSFLVFENHATHMHVAATVIFDKGPFATADGGVDIERIRAYIESRLYRIPRYRQRLAWIPLENYPVWVDDDHFNIDYHVRHTSLPRPGDEQQLKRLSARIVSQQLDRGKPLWETWIVEGLDGDRFAMVTKTHHCMIDGISGVDILTVLLDMAPDGTIEETPPFIPRPAPRGVQLLREEVFRRVREPFGIVSRVLSTPGELANSMMEGLSAVGETIAGSLGAASETPFNRPIGPHRRFDWLTMDLGEVKAVKNRLGGTVNDVVLATVSGAVRRFLEGRRINVETLDFRAMVPVSTRTAQERGTLGNRVSGWVTTLPIAERDPRERLAKVSRTTADLKDSRQAMGAEMLAQVTEWTGSTLLTIAMRLALRARPFNLVVTNVPGPQIPLYLLGSRMRCAYPLVPLFFNQGLGIALFSYAGKLFWGFNADWDTLPDLDVFAEAIQASFAELLGAAGQQVVMPVSKRRPRQPRAVPPPRHGRRSAAHAAN